MFEQRKGSSIDGARSAVQRSAGIPQVSIPPGHVGPFVLPGSGRLVYWTGRVAIGLRHERRGDVDAPVSQSALWVQNVMLGPGRARAHRGPLRSGA